MQIIDKTDRESYFKKLEYYEAHKEYIDELVQPREVPQINVRTAYPTDKAKMLLKLLEV